MSVYQYQIKRYHERNFNWVGSFYDFDCKYEDVTDLSTIVNNPFVSLYCLEHKSRQAIFVETPKGVDLSKAPFYYQAQYKNAFRVFTVPFDTFNISAGYMPSINRPVFIYTTGRSGSTLLHHCFNKAESSVSLSEPDALIQCLDYQNTTTEACKKRELKKLATSSIRFLFYPYRHQNPRVHVVKLRSHGLQAMGFFQSKYSRAKNIFLYRSAFGFVASGLRVYQKLRRSPYTSFTAWKADYEHWDKTNYGSLSRYLGEDNESFSLVHELTLRWIAAMEWFAAAVEAGIPALSIRYDNLRDAQEDTLAQIFHYCGLPINNFEQILSVFKQDSQAGTNLSRPEGYSSFSLTPEAIYLVTSILSRHSFLDPEGIKI
jgi:hypothetical protein